MAGGFWRRWPSSGPSVKTQKDSAAERIEATDDLERLPGAMRQGVHIQPPEELDL
jgi:hypothetical protein